MKWQRVARWVKEGKFILHQAFLLVWIWHLGLLLIIMAMTWLQDIANHTEYYWQKDPSVDNFARIYGYE